MNQPPSNRALIFGLLFFVLLFDSSHCWTYFTDNEHVWMLAIENREMNCQVIDDRRRIDNIIRNEPHHVKYMDPLMLKDLMYNCYQRYSYPIATTSNPLGGFFTNTVIFPGTKWCGPGTTASSYEDLGSNKAVDMCCREHDHCPVSLLPGHCHKDLCNPSPVTISHCDCDEKFRQCLYDVNTNSADAVGTLYFNLGGLQCLEDRCLNINYDCPAHFMTPPPFRSEEHVLRYFTGIIARISKQFI